MKISEAIIFAFKAHEGQKDKSGEDYIKHPLEVMSMITEYGWATQDYMVVAVLHDVLEDCWPINSNSGHELLANCSQEQEDALLAITRKVGESYKDYLSRVKDNHIARIVKIADLKHNLNPERLEKTPKEFQSISNRYKDALSFLQKHIIKY